MATFDGLWVIYRPATAGRTKKSNHCEGIIYALGDTRAAAWQHACRVMYGGAFAETDETQAEELRRMGYRAKRCTILVEV